jgi:ankyrin repeat protein
MMKVEHVNLLLQKGAKIELTNNNGETPLHNMNVPVEKIDILLQQNANKEAVDNKGETPLVKAVRLGTNKL